jgi:CheY-like chemotaxis protein
MIKTVTNRPIKRGKILVIEDNLDQWAIIKYAAALVLPRTELSIVTNSEEATSFLKDCLEKDSNFPQLILLDLYLPQRADGWALLQQIKGMASPINRIPLIMLSCSDCAEDINQSYIQGGNAYLIKPTDFNGWQSAFETLKDYWLNTVTLPTQPNRFI